MRSWQIKALPNGRCAIHDNREKLIAADLERAIAQDFVAVHNKALDDAVEHMIPMSNDGDFVFIDGPGDVELDHSGTMRSALEAIANGQGEQALIAKCALEKIDLRRRPAIESHDNGL